MIPQADIINWSNFSPWSSPDQIEHDLVLSRVICELYSNEAISNTLIFRGGTALHKLFFKQAGRFSEDLDFVQAKSEPIGVTIAAIRDCLDHWLGNPSWKQNQGRFTLNYRFTTELEPVISRKVKIEINTREHFSFQPHVKKRYHVLSPWFRGESTVLTYSIEELLATKLRALYQRKKGRDLFDFWYAIQHIPDLDVQETINIFHHYMRDEKVQVSRAEFEKNLSLKRKSPVFNGDIKPLLSATMAEQYQIEEAYEILFREFFHKLSGDSWKGIE